MTMSSAYRLQVANTFLLLVVGLLVVVSGIETDIAEALRFTLYAVGALVVIFTFREILTTDETQEDR